MNMILAGEADGVDLNEPLVLALAHARARGESAYQIAARAGVHPSELSRWANGRRAPSAEQAARVADALGCRVEVIFPVNELSPAGKPGSAKTSDAGAQNAIYPA
jgi:transcriptional regulator with XRE-family HTH domain